MRELSVVMHRLSKATIERYISPRPTVPEAKMFESYRLTNLPALREFSLNIPRLSKPELDRLLPRIEKARTSRTNLLVTALTCTHVSDNIKATVKPKNRVDFCQFNDTRKCFLEKRRFKESQKSVPKRRAPECPLKKDAATQIDVVEKKRLLLSSNPILTSASDVGQMTTRSLASHGLAGKPAKADDLEKTVYPKVKFNVNNRGHFLAVKEDLKEIEKPKPEPADLDDLDENLMAQVEQDLERRIAQNKSKGNKTIAQPVPVRTRAELPALDLPEDFGLKSILKKSKSAILVNKHVSFAKNVGSP